MNLIDVHNHSLPGIDDGAKDVDMALDMLRVARDSGVTDIVLTPHHLNGAFNNFTDSVRSAVESLREAAQNHEIHVNLHPGSEVHVVPETVEHLIENKALTFCGLGKAALLELPKSSIPRGVESILSELIFNGITPVIAHPERNSALRKNLEPLREWVEFGCKAQATGQSVSGKFGDSIQKITFQMIEEGLVHLVASDAHRPVGRSPDLGAAVTTINNKFGKELAELLFYQNPQRLLRGEELERPAPLKSRAGNTETKKRPSSFNLRRWLNKR